MADSFVGREGGPDRHPPSRGPPTRRDWSARTRSGPRTSRDWVGVNVLGEQRGDSPEAFTRRGWSEESAEYVDSEGVGGASVETTGPEEAGRERRWSETDGARKNVTRETDHVGREQRRGSISTSSTLWSGPPEETL